MATVTLRSLHPHGIGIAAIPSVTVTAPRFKYQKCPFLSFPFSQKQKSLALQISPITACAWRISAYASAPYTESQSGTDTEIEPSKAEDFVNQREGDTGETGEEVVVVPVQPAKAELKRLKKDRARLYVGNLPYSATSNELSELFSEAGTVTSADVSLVTLLYFFRWCYQSYPFSLFLQISHLTT